MKTLRILALTSLVAGFGLMTGCDTTSSSSAPEVTEFETANFADATDTWASGMDLEFYGTAKDDNSLKTLKLDIINTVGTVVYTSTKNVSGTSADFGANKSTVFTINNPGTWAAGAYTVKITATDNDGLTATKTLSLAKVAGTGTTNPGNLTESSVTLGGLGNSSYGSYLDADAMVVYKSTPAAANAAAIDLVFNNTADGKNEVRSPSDADWLTWGTKNTTKIQKVTATFESITTQVGIDALYSASAASTTLQGIVSGNVLVIHTSAGKNVLLKVSSIANSGASTVEFSIKGYK